ncbi:MAG: hypothetical protein ABIP35_01820 [Ginsengibacter sp.]
MKVKLVNHYDGKINGKRKVPREGKNMKIKSIRLKSKRASITTSSLYLLTH